MKALESKPPFLCMLRSLVEAVTYGIIGVVLTFLILPTPRAKKEDPEASTLPEPRRKEHSAASKQRNSISKASDQISSGDDFDKTILNQRHDAVFALSSNLIQLSDSLKIANANYDDLEGQVSQLRAELGKAIRQLADSTLDSAKVSSELEKLMIAVNNAYDQVKRLEWKVDHLEGITGVGDGGILEDFTAGSSVDSSVSRCSEEDKVTADLEK